MEPTIKKRGRGRPPLPKGEKGIKTPHTPEGYFLAYAKVGEIMYTTISPSQITARVAVMNNRVSVSTEIVLVVSDYRQPEYQPQANRITKITILNRS